MASYAAPRDPGGSRWRPWKLPLFCAAVIAALFPLFSRSDDPTDFAFWIVPFAFTCGPTLWRVWSDGVRGYSVREDGVRIERRGTTTWIGPFDIRAVGPLVEPLPAELERHLTKPRFIPETRFEAGPLGFVTSAATHRRDLVILDTEKERYLLSPEQAEGFIQDVLGNAPNAKRTDVPGPPFRRPGGGRDLGRGFVIAIGAAVAALIALGAVAQAPRSFAVDRDVIAIHRLVAGDVELPFDEVLSIEPLGEEALRGATRVNARRLPGGVAWGRFQSNALGEFRLFASRRGPAVLVNAKIGKVVLTPEDPAAFMAQVRERLARR